MVLGLSACGSSSNKVTPTNTNNINPGNSNNGNNSGNAGKGNAAGTKAKSPDDASAAFKAVLMQGLAKLTYKGTAPVATDYLASIKGIPSPVGLDKISGSDSANGTNITADSGSYACIAVMNFDSATKKASVGSVSCK